MRDILKRIIIGVAIGMALFFLKTEVFALSYDVIPQEDFFVFNNSPVSVIIQSSSTSNTQIVNRIDFHNSFTNTAGHDFAVFVFSLVEEGNINYNQSTTARQIYLSYIGIKLISTSSWSTCQMQDSLIVCPLKKDVKYTALQFYSTKYTVDFYININLTNSMTYFDSYYSGMIDSFQQQTDDILNSDASSDATYNNDYSTNAYDTAESNMNSNLDTDVSGLSFDPTSWTSTFSYIWSLVTDFLRISNKVFITITTFLTFSFVGLVIGRS